MWWFFWLCMCVINFFFMRWLLMYVMLLFEMCICFVILEMIWLFFLYSRWSVKNLFKGIYDFKVGIIDSCIFFVWFCIVEIIFWISWFCVFIEVVCFFFCLNNFFFFFVLYWLYIKRSGRFFSGKKRSSIYLLW